VIALEATSRDPHHRGELVELLDRGVAHQVTPPLVTEPPAGLVDQDRHVRSLAHDRRPAKGPATLGGVSTEEAELRIAWQRHVGDAAHFESVVGRYREPHRHYHGLQHLVRVVRHVHELAEHQPVDDLDAVVAAAFYHDAVYDPSSSDNENASARLAERHLTELGWPSTRVERVASMVRATAHHDASDDHAAVLLDADLAVLGEEPAVYQAYANGVRAEYHHVDDAAWRRGRTAVLAHFLQRPTLYATPVGRARWEARARANLTAELASLR
jgi:predicted metal-dependent HD superfamily phosphohydrolase